ncbi:MAG: hypothetical protein JXQ29_02180 [Planctomycetes bacterium]|nr:hypothetical protein [Planctomycetota bacterium]
MTGSRRGVYFLADDRVLELAVAFLNSFRRHNPDLPLVLIPCTDRCARVIALASQYAFEVFADPAVLGRCDAVGRHFHDRVFGQYRKLAMWEGALERFLYIDVDTVILGRVHFVFKYLSHYAFVASHSHYRKLRKWVWKRSIRRSKLLNAAQIAYAASTGFLASRRDALRLEHAEAVARRDAARLKPHLELRCVEQPFLNYLIVTSGLPYTSLCVLEKAGADPEMMAERWAGERLGIVRRGTIRFPGRRPPTLLLHWAGLWQPTALDRWLRARGHRGGGDPECLPRRWLRYKRLWMHYRRLREPGRP